MLNKNSVIGPTMSEREALIRRMKYRDYGSFRQANVVLDMPDEEVEEDVVEVEIPDNLSGWSNENWAGMPTFD